MIFYDLGARFGEAASNLNFSNYSKVVGYEANPDITSVPAGYTEWVRAAAWTYDGVVNFVAGSDHSDCSGVEGYNCVYSRPITSRLIEIPCVDFPKIVSENGPCDIKMDVEGAEWILLPALIPIAKLIKNLYIEWHHSEKGNNDTENDLKSKLKAEGVIIHPWF